MLKTHLIGFAPVRGKRVSLARCAPQHAEFLQQCYTNEAFMDVYRLAQNRAQTVEQIRARLTDEQQYPPHELKRLEWVIIAHLETGELPIGMASLANFIPHHRRAELLFGIIEQSDQKGRQGMEAMLLILEYAFNVLQLNKLTSLVYGHNRYAQDSTLALGFTQEGFLRQHIYHKPYGFIDLYQNGLLVADFRANQRLRKLGVRMLGRDITRLHTENTRPLTGEELMRAQASLNEFLANPTEETTSVDE